MKVERNSTLAAPKKAYPCRARRPFRWWGPVAGLLAVPALLLPWTHVGAQPVRTEKLIAPGLVLTEESRNWPLPPNPLRPPDQPNTVPVRFFLVRGLRTDGWKLDLELADAANPLKKRTVRAIAQSTAAPIVLNGGFFAYGGAAVGAVRKNFAWQRGAWKSRTALGFAPDGKRTVGELSTAVKVSLGKRELAGVTLNGLSRSYSYATANQFAVISAAPNNSQMLPAGARALVVQNGRVVASHLAPIPPAPAPAPPVPAPLEPAENAAAGNQTPGTQVLPAPLPAAKIAPTLVPIPPGGWLLVSLAPEAVAALDVPLGTSASWKMETQPGHWAHFPTILGAGPRLVAGGAVFTTEKQEEFRPDVLARGPRSAVAWDAAGNWMLLAVDGRQESSAGLTLPEIAALLKELGAVEAMNLDGGSSTQLAVQGVLVNTPSGKDPVDPTRQREVLVTNALVLRR